MPRLPQQIQGRSGEKVLDGECKVRNKSGEDVTEQFIRSAEEVLKIARQLNVQEFMGKLGFPSRKSVEKNTICGKVSKKWVKLQKLLYTYTLKP